MRIISGKYRGHRLLSFKLSHIRPTTDRAKEIIFNKLMSDIGDARVLDLFSGTGNLAFEALSREASSVDAVEMHPKSVQLIRENAKKLGVGSELKVHKKDVFKYIASYEGESFEIVFIDPPFTKKLAHDVMSAIGESSLLSQGTIVIIEATIHEKMETSYPGLVLTDEKDLGDKKIFFFLKE